MKNYYEILGVSEDATQDDIKKAYRKLSKQYHPDVNPEGEEKFKDIAEAYDNIGEPKKREDYNMRRNNPFAEMGGGGFDIHSMFEQMVNGQRQQRRAPDKVITLEITPVESYFGVKKEITVDILENCVNCNGSGGDRHICNTCNGNGFVLQIFGTGMFQQQIQMTCNVCNGHGSKIVRHCGTCNGNGRTKKVQKINVSIPSNSDNGDFMRVKGKGDYSNQSNLHGDLILKININENTQFQKSGYDLIYNKKIDVLNIIIDDTIDIEHPEGTLRISTPKNLDSDKPLRIPGKGYKTPQGNGNFYIKLTIQKNNEIDQEIRDKIRDLLEKSNKVSN
jgi:molecular chaperone DnaJ